MPDLPDDVVSNDEIYGYTASVMEVKMQSGQTKEEPTLPFLLRHLPKYKAPGCVGDRYEHYQAMPFAFVEVLVHDALNRHVSDGFGAAPHLLHVTMTVPDHDALVHTQAQSLPPCHPAA